MAAFLDIASAFEARLAAMPGGLPSAQTAHDGVAFDPSQLAAGTPWQKTTLLPADTEAAGVGVDARNRHDGVYQISLFYPSGKGLGAVLAQADAIASWFKRGTSLDKNTTSIEVTAVLRGPAIPDAEWVMVPVSIQYFAHALN